jgi:hypothetical protein
LPVVSVIVSSIASRETERLTGGDVSLRACPRLYWANPHDVDALANSSHPRLLRSDRLTRAAATRSGVEESSRR